MMTSPIQELRRTTPNIAELAAQLRAGQTTSVELTEQALSLLDGPGRQLNAVVTMTSERALNSARQADHELRAGHDRGPLHGIPYGAKDLLATRDYPTTWGAAPFRDQTFDFDAAVIERLDQAGAVLVAKLAMVELAGGFGYDQPNAAFTGPGLNPWNTAAWSGGSSSGSGSAVGAGCVPFAIGSETFGSITTPSSYCGIVGLRPTYGRVSRYGAMALSWTLDKLGPMTTSVLDAATVLQAIAGYDRRDPASLDAPLPDLSQSPSRTWRIAIPTGVVDQCQPEVAAAFERTREILSDFATITEITLPDLPTTTVASLIINAEAASAFEEFFASGQAQQLTAPEDRTGIYPALTISAVDLLRAYRIRGVAMRQTDALFQDIDAIVAPTLNRVAPPLDMTFTDYYQEPGSMLGGLGNLCGLPAITQPIGIGERNLPIGIEVLGRALDEATIIQIARELETRLDW